MNKNKTKIPFITTSAIGYIKVVTENAYSAKIENNQLTDAKVYVSGGSWCGLMYDLRNVGM